MNSVARFSDFIRRGGHAGVTLDLRATRSAPEVKHSTPAVMPLMEEFETRLRGVAAENWTYLVGVFQRAVGMPDRHAEDVEDLIHAYQAEFEQRVTALTANSEGGGEAAVFDPAILEADIDTTADWLARRFGNDINEERQRALGVTHYIWRSQDDVKVRTAHAERDDRLFSWKHRFPDGHPGHGYNCRCFAEPAILEDAILLTNFAAAPDLARQIRAAQAAGLAEAATDAAVGGAQSIYSVLRFSYLGYRRLFGVITPEEEAERLAMRYNLMSALGGLAELDGETARQIADAFVEYFDARHADLRLLDLEHRLGLVSEDALLRAYRNVAYMDAATALGASALATTAAKLGVNLGRLRPRETIVALRSAASPFDGMLYGRRATVQEFVARRFAALEAQGHGPQRHEGAVTRQRLEDRVLRGIDPMTGTRTDGVSGRRHVRSWAATRITTPEAFVAAEAFIRRTPDYRTARDAALFDPAYWRGRFEVILPIEDVLGPDFRSLVEGVRRNTGPADLSGLSEVVFDEGLMVARFALDSMGEPRLITMFPVGR